MRKFQDLNDLLIDMLKDIYHAEKQIVKVLPKMIKKSSSDELKSVFKDHLKESESQIKRLEKVFEYLDAPVKAKKCVAVEGIIEEGKELLTADIESHVRDAGLIVTAQKIEHYEIAAYGSMKAFAETLGFDEVADIFQDIVNEEGDADKRLTEISESINSEASQADFEYAGIGLENKGGITRKAMKDRELV